VTFEDLLPENLVAVDSMRSAFQVAAQRLGREFTPKFSVRSAGVAISLVQAGLGVTVQPECLLGLEMFDRAVAIDLAEPWASRSINIATLSGRSPTAATGALIAHLIQTPRVTAEGTGSLPG
jgi:DNA-binding transcriptional LysR family regulator